jgi:sigma-B regulation protein RsbU (phosphoserine phosphatase)
MNHRQRGVDRRRLVSDFDFPLTLASGEVVAADRRSGEDRRELGRVARQPLFRGVAFSVIETLTGQCEFLDVATGQRLLEPGQANDRLLLLLEGRFDVRIDRPDAPGIIEIMPGECTGEISIIDGKPATAYVIAAEPSRVLAVGDAVFWSEFVRHPRVAKNFMKLFAERLRARNLLMQQAVEEHLRYESLEKELSIAAQIQASMLPRDFSLETDVDVVAEMIPARHVGGDFYDVFLINDHQFYVAVGDVAGKGVPASLFVVKAMTILRAEMLKSQDLDEAVAAFNRELSRNNDQCMFVTLAIVVFDRRTGRGQYVSAGHNAVALGRSGRDFDYLPSPKGILAGIDENASFQSESIQITPGDVLVIYSDGVTEAMNPAQQLFTDKRLLDELNAKTVSTSGEAARRLIRAVQTFADGAPQSDDLTLVILRFR